jgi:hypothetical protein
MKSLLPQKYHYYIYIFALIILVIGLPLSKFLMSLSQIVLVCNWFLEGNLKNKIVNFWKNRPALILSSLMLLHFIGLIYSSDYVYAFADIRVKGPLLILPLIISTSQPLSKKLFNSVLQLLVASVIFGTIVSSLVLADVIHRQIVDVRNISIFISHIRFALLICVAIFISGYFIYDTTRLLNKLIWSLIIIWLIAFLILMESLTGLAVLSFILLVLIIYFILKSKNSYIKYGGVLVICISILSVLYFINTIKNDELKKEVIVDYDKLADTTAHGGIYKHDYGSRMNENGHLIWIYFCMEELEQSWNKRSTIKFSDKDLKGNDVRFTLIRYLASKGLRKDADAVNSLTDSEIKAIERGVANVNYQNISSLKGRLHEIFWEIDLYRTTGDPNGHSLTQRFEYWKTAVEIIKHNVLFGVGVGDVQDAFDEQYIKTNSPLLKKWRFHSHNQYLSITVAFGLFGLLWFLMCLFYPMVKQKMMFDYLYITFFMIVAISFLTEDTLETQAGVTFYAFFNSFFLFARKKDEIEN